MKRLLFIFALVASIVVAQAQTVTLKSPYGLPSDTVTNGGTAFLTSAVLTARQYPVTVQANLTEISGTTAGTLTLQGSLDGINFVALTDSTTVPAVTTKTATDVASQTFAWQLSSSPFLYYRVSWTGAGTMASSFTAVLVRQSN